MLTPLPWIVELWIYSMVVCIIIANVGYGLTLPGYSRRKMLNGYSALSQIKDRYWKGRNIMSSIWVVANALTLAFFLMSLFVPYDQSSRIVPREIEVLYSQGHTILLADGELFDFEEEEISEYVDEDGCGCTDPVNENDIHPCIYFKETKNMYGLSLSTKIRFDPRCIERCIKQCFLLFPRN